MAQRRAGIKEVAKQAGVSVGTVSNVLNNPGLVAEETRARVEAAVEELGYVINRSARDLRAGQSSFVGLLVLDVRNPFFTDVARGVEDGANAAGYAVVLCNSDSIEKEARYLRWLEEQRASGLVITPVVRDMEPIDRLRERGMSVVLLDRPSPRTDLCSVAVDDIRGGEVAARHLLGLGHERLGFVTGPLTIQQCAERREGMRSEVAGAGLDPDRSVRQVEVETLNADGGEKALEALLADDDLPTAVFCVNDLLALGVLRGLRDRGIEVPDDVAIVGYDDVEFTYVTQPPLTTVRQPKYRLGQEAARLLFEELDPSAEHHHQQLQFLPELVVRASTAP